MANITGKILPLKDKIFVTNMEFGIEKTAGGIIVPGDNGKTTGIHPRWGQVWAVGPEQEDVTVGAWILMAHGRWTRAIKVEEEDGTVREVHMVDANAIMLSADEKPSDVYRADS